MSRVMLAGSQVAGSILPSTCVNFSALVYRETGSSFLHGLTDVCTAAYVVCDVKWCMVGSQIIIFASVSARCSISQAHEGDVGWR